MQHQNNFFKDYRKLAALLSGGAVFTAFDTETTGLNTSVCRIIEIGAVQFNAEGVIGSFSTLINPLSAIPPETVKIHHITDSMLTDKPTIDKVLPDFMKFLGNSIILAHNAQFDMNFLNAELQRCSLSPAKNMIIDTLRLCRWAYPDEKKYKQTAMAEKMGIEIKNAHRAYDDAFVCGNIFLHCIKDTAKMQKI